MKVTQASFYLLLLLIYILRSALPPSLSLSVYLSDSHTTPTTGGNPRIVTTVTVQLSGDRRVVDEALAAQFLQVFKSYFSNPKLLYL